MSKKDLQQSLNTLISEDNTPAAKTKKMASMCFSMENKLVEAINYIAHYDRKKLSDVATEAFTTYVRNWQPAPQEPPKKLEI